MAVISFYAQEGNNAKLSNKGETMTIPSKESRAAKRSLLKSFFALANLFLAAYTQLYKSLCWLLDGLSR